jgi:hypothetical protein
METITLIAATQRDPTDFSEALEASLKGDVADESLNDLDDYMMELSKTEPVHVVELAEIAAELYRKYESDNNVCLSA